MEGKQFERNNFFRNSVDLEEYFKSASPTDGSPKNSDNPRSMRRSLNLSEWLQAKRFFDTKNPSTGETLGVKEYFPNPDIDSKRVFYLEKMDDGYCHRHMKLKGDEKARFTYSMY